MAFRKDSRFSAVIPEDIQEEEEEEADAEETEVAADLKVAKDKGIRMARKYIIIPEDAITHSNYNVVASKESPLIADYSTKSESLLDAPPTPYLEIKHSSVSSRKSNPAAKRSSPQFNGSLTASGTAGRRLSQVPPRSRKQAVSASEATSIRNHHKELQKKYSVTRQPHFTDPVDFDGILRIIGGFGRWQVFVYLVLIVQQLPRAMFNLSITYDLFEPDHGCYVMDFDVERHAHFAGWTVRQIQNIVAPLQDVDDHGINTGQPVRSKCTMYNRHDYHAISHMTYENASLVTNQQNTSIGYCKRWMYDRSVMQETVISQWNLVCANRYRQGDMHLSFLFGAFFGCFIGGITSDRFGRKPALVAYAVLSSVLTLILPYSTSFLLFLLLRFLATVCVEAGYLTTYILGIEIVGIKERSFGNALLQLPFLIGSLLLVPICMWIRNWKTIHLLIAVLQTLSTLCYYMVPESPRWLIGSSRMRDAEIIIRRACNVNKMTLPPNLELIRHPEQQHWIKSGKKPSLCKALKSSEILMRIAVLSVLWVATLLNYYGVLVYLDDALHSDRTAIDVNFFLRNAIVGASEFPSFVLCLLIARFSQRKVSHVILFILTSLSLILVAVSLPKYTVMHFFLAVLAKALAMTLLYTLYLFTVELFPTIIRNSTVGICSMIACIGVGIAAYTRLISVTHFSWYPSMIFGVFSLLSAFLVLLMPETRDANLPDSFLDAVVL